MPDFKPGSMRYHTSGHVPFKQIQRDYQRRHTHGAIEPMDVQRGAGRSALALAAILIGAVAAVLLIAGL